MLRHIALQTPEQLETFVKQLKAVSGSMKVNYIYFARIFSVRVCEDYGLISPCLSSDDICAMGAQAGSELLARINNSYFRLIKEMYPGAGLELGNPLFWDKLDDGDAPDEHTILALYTLLRRYNLRGLSVDVLGRVYSEGYIENWDRSEKGQFYTPSRVVEYMLDSLGMPASSDDDYKNCYVFLEKTVGDLSCGSGSFLVAAAARKRAILQRLVAAREISPEQAVRALTDTLLGFDLNAFACYLAEMNLLMQCLPFLSDEQGRLCRSVERFRIYCADILESTINERASMVEQMGGASPAPTRSGTADSSRFVAEPQQGIDYLVGNPPYVSAGESSNNLVYRGKIASSGIYRLLYQRWDMFVPFFERNLQFLRVGTGRLGLIVSNGIETEGYAARLRQALSSQYRLLQIDFFPGLRLFPGAAVENTIVLVENRPPDEGHEVIRRKHMQADCKHFEMLPPVPQLRSNDRVFRWRYDPNLDKSLAEGTVLLCAIAYIGTGIEAQSNEDFDPVIEGKRQKRFTLDDVFLEPPTGTTRPGEYTDDGVLGDDVGSYYVRCRRYVAYEKFRLQMRGPRHVALFRTAEKLLLGETSGGYYDRDRLFANHSVQVVVSWKALEQAGAIVERGIQRVYRKSHQISGIKDDLASIGELFDLRYLLAIINSRFMREYITSNMHEGTRKGRIYPDVWKRLPIKVAPVERQLQIARLVDAVQDEYKQVGSFATPSPLHAQRHTTIDMLLSEIENLVEVTYREPAHAEMMEMINAQLTHLPLSAF